MRIVVVSDSHNNFGALCRIVRSQPAADCFIHLGDGEEEFEDLRALYPGKVMLGVRGNCDWSSCTKTQDTLLCGGIKIFYTHGHLFGVKSGLDKLKEYARAQGAQVALFGHTHIGCATYDSGLYLLNPGSVSHCPRVELSYGVLDITEAGVAAHLVPLKGMGK